MGLSPEIYPGSAVSEDTGAVVPWDLGQTYQIIQNLQGENYIAVSTIRRHV